MNSNYVRHPAYGTVQTGDPSTLNPDLTFTGQKADGTGLLYLNARYYNPTLGQFLSPDTLVPDAGVLFDYNRFMYTRGNPLKYTDPTGHYTNDEIMQHFGCSDWACVEGFFQDGGSYAGMWGWLYMLQMAQDGFQVEATTFFGGGRSTLTGKFSRSASGSIGVQLSAVNDWQTDAAMSEFAFGSFAANPSQVFGMYMMNGSDRGYSTAWNDRHAYLYFDPAQIDYGGLIMGVVESGSDFGPIATTSAVKSGNPYAVAGAGTYWVVGEVFSFYNDFIYPAAAYGARGDLQPASETLTVETAKWITRSVAPNAVPFVGPTWDISSSIAPGVCYGTGCRR